MGSIYGIYSPNMWRVLREGKLKDDGRVILEVVAGFEDDYYNVETTLYIFKDHYDDILRKKIQVVTHPYNVEELELFRDGEKIQPIMRNGTYIY